MAKLTKVTRSVNKGELSPLMDARSDQAAYEGGAKIMENFFPLIYGGAQRRPGTEYIATQKDSSTKARSIDFEHSVDDTYNLVFENQCIRMFKDGERVMDTSLTVTGITTPSAAVLVATTSTSHQLSTGDVIRFDSVAGVEGNSTTPGINYNGNHSTEYPITVVSATTFSLDNTNGANYTSYTSDGTVASILEVTSPYLSDDLFQIKVEQSADVMFITHPSYEERQLSRSANTDWDLEAPAFVTGPFRDQNTITSKTITADSTTGTVTLTAVGHEPFVTGTTAGHPPSGATATITEFADYDGTYADSTKVKTSAAHGFITGNIVRISGTTSYDGQWNVTLIDADELYIKTPFVADDATGDMSDVTDKAQTGALYKLIHASNNPSIGEELNSTTLNDVTTTLAVPKGITWDFTTNGTWGTSGPSSIVLERSYDDGTTYETVFTVTSLANKNATTSDTEDVADAIYRARVSVAAGTGNATIQLSIRDTSHIGIVEITAVASSTSATGIVRQTLGSTDPTHRWSEGSFSNYRGWPIAVTISAEERLTFAGNRSEPLTTWGSVIGDFENFAEGVDDSDAIQFTLVGTGQQNRIRWMLGKDALVIGTVGGEHLLGASKTEEALTPTNVKAKLQTTYGSEDLTALLVNQAVLFLQRGGKKIRELLYNFDVDSYKADDLTVFANHITGDGIVDMAFQRTPDPRLWCIRTDGEIALLVYERDQNIFSWSRYVTDGEFESIAVIFGGSREEDEVWVTVKREYAGVDSDPVRYIERFSPQEFDQVDEAVMLDAAKVVSSAFGSQDIVIASDTVRCDEGLCNSSLCGGVPA
jgi:hypothetical protein